LKVADSSTVHYEPLYIFMSQPTELKKIIVQRVASVLSVRNDNMIVIVSPFITV